MNDKSDIITHLKTQPSPEGQPSRSNKQPAKCVQDEQFAQVNQLALLLLLLQMVAETSAMFGHLAAQKFQVLPLQLFRLQEQVQMMQKHIV
jgi:hypothetical protein